MKHRVFLRLEDESGTLGLLVTTVEQTHDVSNHASRGGEKNGSIPQLKVLASFQGKLGLSLADGTLQPQHNLLRCLCLFVEDWLGLTSVARLLAVITTLSLGKQRGLNGYVSYVLGKLSRERTFPALY